MANASGFGQDIDRELAELLTEWRELIMSIAQAALERIVSRTPVLTGQARANWFVSIGAEQFLITTNVDPTGAVAISRGTAVIATYRTVDGFPDIVIHSDLPYILKLENGYSAKAPNGMVAITHAELEAGA